MNWHWYLSRANRWTADEMPRTLHSMKALRSHVVVVLLSGLLLLWLTVVLLWSVLLLLLWGL